MSVDYTAFEKASTIFISDYLSNWKYIYESPIPTTVAVTTTRAVSGALYSPLATSDVAGGGSGGASPPAIANGVAADLESDIHSTTTTSTAEESPRGKHICILCNKALFTEGVKAQVIQLLHCKHTFHKVCILHVCIKTTPTSRCSPTPPRLIPCPTCGSRL